MLVVGESQPFAVTLAMCREDRSRLFAAFTGITAIFLYTTVVNIVERPDGIRIAAFFIRVIVVTALKRRSRSFVRPRRRARFG